MELTDIKLIYFKARGELRRVGKNYLLKHYLSTYNDRTIVLHGYTKKGSQTIINLENKIEIINNEEARLVEEVYNLVK